MEHRVLNYSLVFIITLNCCFAQRNSFSDQDGFVFPGEAERPEKFPLRPTSTRPTGNGGRFTTSSTPTTGINTTPSSAAYNQCFDRCQTTSEYNPVCGTDNVVYSNPGRLNCARNCGNMITMKNYGQCSTGPARG